jgi:uncharacterized protein YdhG (YjbR/CyaY superfamily)
MPMFQSKAATVAEYLDALPEDRRDTVVKLRKLVKRHMPKGYAEEMAWGAITYSIPLSRFPDTYNGQPLCYAALAAQKNHCSLYLMNVYGDAAKRKELEAAFKKAGKKMDAGKSCIRFQTIDDLPLEAIANVIASTPPDVYIKIYEASRKKSAK